MTGSIDVKFKIQEQPGVIRSFPGYDLVFEILHENQIISKKCHFVEKFEGEVKLTFIKFEGEVKLTFTIPNKAKTLLFRISQRFNKDDQLIKDFPIEITELIFDNIFSLPKILHSGQIVSKANVIDTATNIWYSDDYLVYKFNLPFFGCVNRVWELNPCKKHIF